MTRREPASLSAAKYLDPMGLPLRLIRRDPERECSLHRHEFSELVVVYGGGGTHLAFGGAHRLSPGDVFLIGAPGPPHGFINTRDLALYNRIRAAALDDSDLERLQIRELLRPRKSVSPGAVAKDGVPIEILEQ